MSAHPPFDISGAIRAGNVKNFKMRIMHYLEHMLENSHELGFA